MKHATADVLNMSAFQWTDSRTAAALELAEGGTEVEAAEVAGVTDRTIRRWKKDIEFAAEVDRLTLMMGIATRAERLRIAKRVIREKTKGATPDTARDLLDWIKLAQSETDGMKLDLVALAEALGNTNDQ